MQRAEQGWDRVRGAAVVVMAVVVGLMVPGTVAAARRAEAPSIVIVLSASSVRVRGTVNVRGQVTPPDATPSVVVQRQVGSAWRDVATGTVGSDGRFSVPVSPTQLVDYVLRARSAGGTITSTAVILHVTPPPTIAAALSQSAIVIGQPLLVSGTVRPADATGHVVLQRLVGGTWSDRQRVAVRGSDGSFVFGVVPTSATPYDLRVRSDRGSVVSPTLHLEVSYVGNDMRDFGDARPGEKVIALTFDDGPSPTDTAKLLAVLDKYQVKATFAVVGYEAKDHADLLAKMVRDGQHLANHSWDHPILTRLSDAEVRSQLARTDALITKAGYTARCVRPPYGSHNARIQQRIAEVRSSGTLMWNVNPDDYTRPGASVIASRVLAHLSPGAIIALHDGGGNRSQTIAAVDALIPAIRARGYVIRPVC